MLIALIIVRRSEVRALVDALQFSPTSCC